MRCHVQALTIKLRFGTPIGDVAALAQQGPRMGPRGIRRLGEVGGHLTPTAVAGSLNVPIGHLQNMKLGPKFNIAYTVGRQLVWGAIELCHRMLCTLREHEG